jgi:hypothetical protein
MTEAPTQARMRMFLLGTLIVGMVGTATELLLIGHIETVLQQIPLMLLLMGSAALIWHVASRRPVTVRALQAAMALFVVSGAVGVILHLRGNAEFELEITPAMDGIELFRKTLTGATPVFAPGSMSLLGIVGLIYSYRHPFLDVDASHE